MIQARIDKEHNPAAMAYTGANEGTLFIEDEDLPKDTDDDETLGKS